MKQDQAVTDVKTLISIMEDFIENNDGDIDEENFILFKQICADYQ